ncbi:MAG: hypothetical protein M0003_10460 [Acidithiobacillus sp.]|nr:hypothetical protein [Acidithiobacillus sp.]
MGNLKYAVFVAALLVSGSVFAGTVKTFNIQTSPGAITEVLLPAGVHVESVYASTADVHIKPVRFGKGPSYRGGVALIPAMGSTKNDIIVNGGNGDTYVVWDHNSKQVPAKVVYQLR